MERLSFKLESFEGPLDLLLYLISKNKLSICDIRITELLDQYMEYIREMRENDMDIKSEFLEMASRLVYIKSAALLPKNEEAQELVKELSGELLEYSICRQIAERFSAMTEGFNHFVREPQKLPPARSYKLKHDKSELVSFYLSAVGRGQRRLPPPASSFSGIVSHKIISVSSKIVYVLRNLWKKKKVKYNTVFESASSRSELVATFLAILELIKGKRIQVNGDGDKTEIELISEEK
ncbi:MAG: segregation and condensation protein A [Acutalibacteraceae bacterium]